MSAVLADCYRDSVHPVVEAGLAELVDDGHEIETGIRVTLSPGHTPGNAFLELESGGLRALLSGDVLHHPLQIHYPEVSSAFCFDPVASAATRRRVLERAVGEGRLLLPAHFPAPAATQVRRSAEGFRCSMIS